MAGWRGLRPAWTFLLGAPPAPSSSLSSSESDRPVVVGCYGAFARRGAGDMATGHLNHSGVREVARRQHDSQELRSC